MEEFNSLLCLENPMDGGAWKAAVHGVAEGWTWLSDFTFTFHFDPLEKEMATHSSVLAWRIPGTGKPGGLPSMGSHRVLHDWSDLAVAVWLIYIHIYIHGNFHGGSDGEESACQAGDWLWSWSQEGFLEKGMTTHCSILAWRIPWTGEPDGLQSMRLQRVRHNWATNTSHFHIWI